MFAIMAGGEEIELHLARVETLDRTLPRPIRVLFDDEGVLEGATLPTFAIERQEEHGALRRIVTWFWHDLSRFTAAIGRGEPCWAAGQLEVLRTSCVNLIRIERGIGAQDDAYEKLDRSMTGGELDALSSTYVPLEIDEMLHAGLVLLRFFRSRAPEVAAIHGVPYPAALDRVMGARLEALAAHLGS